jgi:hypothetical protein
MSVEIDSDKRKRIRDIKNVIKIFRKEEKNINKNSYNKLIVVVLLALGGGSLYYLMKKPDKKKKRKVRRRKKRT